MISIHKALAGLDTVRKALTPITWNFNPQGPRGPRLFPRLREVTGVGFQSTRPSRASTLRETGHRGKGNISIHKALAGLDLTANCVLAEDIISIHKALAGLDLLSILLYNPC